MKHREDIIHSLRKTAKSQLEWECYAMAQETAYIADCVENLTKVDKILFEIRAVLRDNDLHATEKLSDIEDILRNTL